MTPLSARLQAVARLIPDGARVADVGTDHAYLPIALARAGRCKEILACDVREKPLAVAARNIAAAGLGDRIALRQGDGLDPVRPGECDVIVVAGMGGEVIAGILARADWLRRADCLLLLQPMTSPEALRQFLCAQGFALLAEEGVVDRGRPYSILSARYQGGEIPCSPLFSCVGRLNPLRAADRCCLEKTLRRLSDCAADLARAGRSQAAAEWDALARQVAAYLEESPCRSTASFCHN